MPSGDVALVFRQPNHVEKLLRPLQESGELQEAFEILTI